MDNTKIQWTDATWNPIRGCSRVSEGCRNCYAERVAARFSWPGEEAMVGGSSLEGRAGGPYEGLAKMTKDGPRWTGAVNFIEDALDQPLRWKRPRRIFVNSMSDLFHQNVKTEWIMRIFEVMEKAHWHTFQVLTKRPQRMIDVLGGSSGAGLSAPPLKNVWLGVSVEDQETANERIKLLLQAPAAVRWISAEPLLGRIDLNRIEIDAERGLHASALHRQYDGNYFDAPSLLDWVVVGGESGPGSRPMHPNWVRMMREDCEAAEVPFFFKQWGDLIESPIVNGSKIDYKSSGAKGAGVYNRFYHDHGMMFSRVGKALAGRQLDGREWNQYPDQIEAA